MISPQRLQPPTEVRANFTLTPIYPFPTYSPSIENAISTLPGVPPAVG
jgi:hypothetical protein